MKKLKMIAALMLGAVLICGSILSAGALPSPFSLGDVDLDYDLTVKDATLVQKFSANLVDFLPLPLELSDCDSNDRTDVKDATLIQKTVAGLVDYSSWTEGVFSYVYKESFSQSTVSGKAIVGDTVTFTAEGVAEPGPITYEFYVNNELKQSRSENNTFTYKFDNQGTFEIKCSMHNNFDEKYESVYYYTVIDSYDSSVPMIYFVDIVEIGENSHKFVANARFGTAPYEYKFEQLEGVGMYELDSIVKTQDFSSDNEFILEERPYLFSGSGFVRVTVRDSLGNESSDIFMAHSLEIV